jgi:hypothetical protein
VRVSSWFGALSAIIIGVCGVCTPPVAIADDVTFGPHDVRSMFYVAKSENQNQVHYGLRVDANCKPRKDDPVFAYWRRLKKGVRYDEPLVPPGTRLYGASDDQSVQQTSNGGQIKMYVKALKRLPIEIKVEKVGTTCQTTATVVLKGARARLSYAFLQLGRFGLTVKYVDVVGYREKDGSKVVQQFD